MARAHGLQGEALRIDARAKFRLAEEYDAAQERGEVASNGQRGKAVPDENSLPTTEDIGLTRKDIFEARQVRDAEARSPGIVNEAISALVEAGKEPTRTAVRRAIIRPEPASPRPREFERGGGEDGTEPTPEQYRFAYFNRAGLAVSFASWPDGAPEPDAEMVDWADGVIEAWVKLRDSLKERVDRPEAVAARAVAASKAAELGEIEAPSRARQKEWWPTRQARIGLHSDRRERLWVRRP